LACFYLFKIIYTNQIAIIAENFYFVKG